MLRVVNRLFSAVSGRYAETLFASARQEGSLQEVAQDMTFISNLIKESKDFEVLISDPTLKRQDVTSALNELMSKAQFHQTSKRAIELLLSNKRLGALAQMAEDYQKLLESLDKKEFVTVVAAEQLSSQDKTRVEQALKEFDSSKTYEVNYKVDASILGGLQLYFPTAFMDLSLSSRLSKIKDELGAI